MGTLTLRDVDDALTRLLRDRARQRRHSIEQEALSILREALEEIRPTSFERVERARAIAALTPRPQSTDAVTLLREERGL
jgi:plasmid stability protein